MKTYRMKSPQPRLMTLLALMIAALCFASAARGAVKIQGEQVRVIGTITFNFSLDDSKEIEALKAEAAANPESADAYLKLGEAYCKAHAAEGDHTKEEVEAFEHAIRLNPNSAEAYFGLAHAHIYNRPLKKEENLRAAGLLKYAIKLKPDYHEAYAALSDVYQHLDRNDEAIDALKEYAQAYPHQGNPLLARFAMRVSRYEDAVEAFKQMLEVDPSNFYTHFELGSAYAALENRELAMKEYEALKPLNNNLAERLLKAIEK